MATRKTRLTEAEIGLVALALTHIRGAWRADAAGCREHGKEELALTVEERLALADELAGRFTYAKRVTLRVRKREKEKD